MKLYLVATAAGALLTSGCATTLQAHSDHDASQNFSSYHSYAWMADQPMITSPDEAPRVGPLNRRRIEQALENELAAKGFQKSAERGDIMKDFPPR